MMFGQFLAALRLSLRIPLRELSDKSGVSIATISLIENNKVKMTDKSSEKLLPALIELLNERMEAEQKIMKQLLELWR